MSQVFLCDVDNCGEVRAYAVIIQDGDYQGLDFDACSVEHITAYIDQLGREYTEAV